MSMRVNVGLARTHAEKRVWAKWAKWSLKYYEPCMDLILHCIICVKQSQFGYHYLMYQKCPTFLHEMHVTLFAGHKGLLAKWLVDLR